jgi:undecaprenyl diphosphate synthase
MGNILQHLAIVLDGIGEAARERGKSPPSVASEAFELAGRVADHAFQELPDLALLSFFSPEMQGWMQHGEWKLEMNQRWKKGLDLLRRSVSGMGAELSLLGRMYNVPESWKNPASDLSASPSSRHRILWFVNYSGRDEICRAAEKFLSSAPSQVLDEEEFTSCLDTAGLPDPDLIIFAGGHLEHKDFLIWQSSYSEIWYTPKPWLAFSDEDLHEATTSFLHRERRFGKL